MPGQVGHGKDSSVCAGHTAAAGASYWAGIVGESIGEGIWVRDVGAECLAQLHDVFTTMSACCSDDLCHP